MIAKSPEIEAPDAVQLPALVAVTVLVQVQTPKQSLSVMLGKLSKRGSPPSFGFASS